VATRIQAKHNLTLPCSRKALKVAGRHQIKHNLTLPCIPAQVPNVADRNQTKHDLTLHCSQHKALKLANPQSKKTQFHLALLLKWLTAIKQKIISP
jgi:hypothetical protein